MDGKERRELIEHTLSQVEAKENNPSFDEIDAISNQLKVSRNTVLMNQLHLRSEKRGRLAIKCLCSSGVTGLLLAGCLSLSVPKYVSWSLGICSTLFFAGFVVVKIDEAKLETKAREILDVEEARVIREQSLNKIAFDLSITREQAVALYGRTEYYLRWRIDKALRQPYTKAAIDQNGKLCVEQIDVTNITNR